jgi:hypothetical protein
MSEALKLTRIGAEVEGARFFGRRRHDGINGISKLTEWGKDRVNKINRMGRQLTMTGGKKGENVRNGISPRSQVALGNARAPGNFVALAGPKYNFGGKGFVTKYNLVTRERKRERPSMFGTWKRKSPC